jgi:Co/Zn/Cd efflux system component
MGCRTAPVEVNDMASSSCASEAGDAKADRRWRVVLWIALAINAAMFAVEIVAGLASGSRALQGDALDFLGDAANYAISLGVADMALRWRSRAALLKGGTILAFGTYVLATSIIARLAMAFPLQERWGLSGRLHSLRTAPWR